MKAAYEAQKSADEAVFAQQELRKVQHTLAAKEADLRETLEELEEAHDQLDQTTGTRHSSHSLT